MKAKFDFIPKYCPNCGKRLFMASGDNLNALRAELDDFHNGQEFTCDCGLQFGKLTAGGARCANCGNFLEDDEGHRSEIYRGLICDGCYDLEK